MGFKGKCLFSSKKSLNDIKFNDLKYEDENFVIKKNGKGKFYNDELFLLNGIDKNFFHQHHLLYNLNIYIVKVLS